MSIKYSRINVPNILDTFLGKLGNKISNKIDLENK